MSPKELKNLIQQLEKQMRQAAADLNFEQAAELRDKMIELKRNLADAEKQLSEISIKNVELLFFYSFSLFLL